LKYSKIKPYLGLVLAAAFIAICFNPQVKTILTLPEQQTLVVGQSSRIAIKLPRHIDGKIDMQVLKPAFSYRGDAPVSINKNGGVFEILALKPGKASIRLNLFGHIPLKAISVETLAPKQVVPGGHSIGVVLQSKGVMVVGYAPIVNSGGDKIYPAKEQGIQLGDSIRKANGMEVTGEEQLAGIINAQKDTPLTLEISRKGKMLGMNIQGVYCAETNRYRIGLFIRDGIVGVGTMSFWDPATGEFAALGHIISDNDTQQGIEVGEGHIVAAAVRNIKPGAPGRPGEKLGVFDEKGGLGGNIIKNTDAGIFGSSQSGLPNPLLPSVEVAYAHQVRVGSAKIFTVVNGEDIEEFDIEIEKTNSRNSENKNMVIRVTDPELLALTGGIVQGMSGSPIIQDNKIAGAVTHVFLDDPSRGYGIYMDNMLTEMEKANAAGKNISTNYCRLLIPAQLKTPANRL
jgi:stage IV sporulation protein B